MYRDVCLYVKARIFFVKNKTKRSTSTYIHVYVWALVCQNHLIYWSSKSTVGELMNLSAFGLFLSRVSYLCCWVNKILKSCVWNEWVREWLSVIGYTNHVMSPVRQIPPDIPWGGDDKSLERQLSSSERG